jgi:hypothetical protein
MCFWPLLTPISRRVIATWFVILFTGRYPRGIFDYVEGVAAGTTGHRLCADPGNRRYPPFRLEH